MKNGMGRLVAMICAVTVSASAGVQNPGFETEDFSGWLTFGQGWRISSGGDAFSGSFGVVNDVTTSDVDGFRGLFQNIPVNAGASYNAGVYIRTVNVESSESWFELQWLDVNGGIIDQLQSAHVTTNQPFTLMALGEVVAPAGAVTASVRGIVFMPAAPAGDTDFQIFDDFFFDDLSATDLRIETTGAPGVVVSWSTNVSTYQLESTDDPVNSAWVPTTDDAQIVSGRVVVTNAASVPSAQFRLRKP
jgi:hypothetical protein